MKSCAWFVIVLGLVGVLHSAAVADSTDVGICTPQPAAARVAFAATPDLSIDQLATWIAGITCEPVIVAPDVAKHATRLQVVVPGPLTVADARRLFVQTMEAAGLRVTYRRRTYTVSLGPGMPRACPDLAGADAEGGEGRAARAVDASVIAAKVAAAIKRIDPTHVEVPRATVERLLADPSLFTGGARALPAVTGGQVVGFKLYALKPGGIAARLGLVNGDTVTALGGRPLTTLDQALEAYSALREAGTVEVSVTRRGKPVTLTITIAP